MAKLQHKEPQVDTHSIRATHKAYTHDGITRLTCLTCDKEVVVVLLRF